jgi:hypothetical protein
VLGSAFTTQMCRQHLAVLEYAGTRICFVNYGTRTQTCKDRKAGSEYALPKASSRHGGSTTHPICHMLDHFALAFFLLSSPLTWKEPTPPAVSSVERQLLEQPVEARHLS